MGRAEGSAHDVIAKSVEVIRGEVDDIITGRQQKHLLYLLGL